MPSVRRAVPADVNELLELVREFYAADQHQFDPSRVHAALMPLLADDAVGQVWLASDSSTLEPVGYAIVTWGWSLESGGRDALLDEIYVRVQGRGLGRTLLTHAIASARRSGARRMYLETELHNRRARDFYAGHGFVTDASVWMSRDLG